MIISRLTQKYKVGCGRGMSYHDETDYLMKMNCIIDWTKSELHGDNKTPMLKPGECFVIGKYTEEELKPKEPVEGQPETAKQGKEARAIFAFDSDSRLVAIISDTGSGVSERFYREQVKPEYELSQRFYEDYDFELDTTLNLPDSKVKVTPEDKQELYVIKDILNEVHGQNSCYKITMQGEETMGIPVSFWINGYQVWTEEGLLSGMTELIQQLFGLAMSWVYREQP